MKRQPGFWLPPCPKPEEAGVGEDALSRLANSISPAAFEVAAQKAAQMGIPYGNSEVFEEACSNRSSGGSSSREVSANFDSIEDDQLYRVARALYQSGQPEQRVELNDGSVAELYPDDLAILYVRSGRSMDHVDIQAARSVRELDTLWSGLFE